jgi:hypothetical protein
MSDIRVVKALLSLEQTLRGLPPGERPLVVAEILDPQKLPVAGGAMSEPLELVASLAVLARLISQGIRHRRLMPLYLQLLTHRAGASLYVRGFPELAGLTPGALQARFARAVVLGFVRREGADLVAHLNPATDEHVGAEELVVLLAESYSDCEPDGGGAPETPAADLVTTPIEHTEPAPPRTQRVLILGWSTKIASILAELASCGAERFEVTMLSRQAIAERSSAMPRHDGLLHVHHLEDDFTSANVLASAEPASFDSIVFLASSGMPSSEEADARTVLGYALLRWILRDVAEPPEVLVELLDPANSRLFPAEDDLLLVSPRIVSHVLAHVALRRELHAVYEALFVAGGAEITTRSAAQYAAASGAPTFSELEARARARGETVLAVLPGSGRGDARLRLRPAGLERLASGDELVVLAGRGARAPRTGHHASRETEREPPRA